MDAFEDGVTAAIDELGLLLGVASPQDEDDVFFFFIDFADHGVGKGFPALVFVGSGLVRLHREDGIEHQDTA